MPIASNASACSTSAHRGPGLPARAGGAAGSASGSSSLDSSTAVRAVEVLRRSNRPPAHNANPTTRKASSGAPVNGSASPIVSVSSTGATAVGLMSPSACSSRSGFTPTSGAGLRPGARCGPPETGALGSTSPPLGQERPALVIVQFDAQLTPELVMTQSGSPGQTSPALVMTQPCALPGAGAGSAGAC